MQVPWDYMASGREEIAKSEVDKWILDGMKRKWLGQMAWASVLLVICGIATIVGTYFIGQSVGSLITYAGNTNPYVHWNPFQLEYGIFITLIGTILVALSVNFLIATWKKKEV